MAEPFNDLPLQEPVAQEPTTQEPIAQEPTTQEPVAQEPATYTDLVGVEKMAIELPTVEDTRRGRSLEGGGGGDEAYKSFAADRTHGFGSFVAGAIESDNMLWQTMDWMANDRTPTDESFKWTADSWSEAIVDVPEHYHHEIRDARSAQDASNIRADIQHRLKLEESLAVHGTAGTVGRFGLAIADPVFIAAMMATEGAAGLTIGRAILRSNVAGSVAKWGASGSRGRQAGYEIGRHLTVSGARVGVGMGGVTLAQASYSPLISVDDVPTAMMHGAGFGVGLGIAGGLLKTGIGRHAVPKEAWKMTPEQYKARESSMPAGESHASQVRAALEKGEAVPEHVLFEHMEVAKEMLPPQHYSNLQMLRAQELAGMNRAVRPQGWKEFWSEIGYGRTKPMSLAQEFSLYSKQRSAKIEFKKAEKAWDDASNKFLDTVESPADTILIKQKMEAMLDAETNLTNAGIELKFNQRELAPQIEALQTAAKTYRELVRKTTETGRQGVSFIDGKEWTANAGELRKAIKDIDAMFKDWEINSIPKARRKLNELRKLRAENRKALGEELPAALEKVELWLTEAIKGKNEALKPAEARVAKARAELDAATGEHGSALKLGKMKQLMEIRQARAEAKTAEARFKEAEKRINSDVNVKARLRQQQILADYKSRALYEVKAGRPISEMNALMFPELRKQGAKTFREREMEDGLKLLEKEEKTSVSPEVKEDINRTIPEESLAPLESIEWSSDPALRASKDALLGIEEVSLERVDLEVVLDANKVPYSSTDSLAHLEAKYNKIQRDALFEDGPRMKKLVSHLKDNGFSTDVKASSSKAELERALMNFEREVHGEPPMSKEAFKAHKNLEKADVKLGEARVKHRAAQAKAKSAKDGIPLPQGESGAIEAKRNLEAAELAVAEAQSKLEAIKPRRVRKTKEPVRQEVPTVEPALPKSKEFTPLSPEEISAKVEARKAQQKPADVEALNAEVSSAKLKLQQEKNSLSEAKADAVVLEAHADIPKLNATQERVIKALNDYYDGIDGPWREIEGLSKQKVKAMAEEMGKSVTGGDVIQGFHGITLEAKSITALDYVDHIKQRYGELMEIGESVPRAEIANARAEIPRLEKSVKEAKASVKVAEGKLKEGEALNDAQARELEVFRRETERGNVDPNVRAQEKLTKAVVTAEKRLAEARVREAEATQRAYDAAKKENPLYTEWEKNRNTRRSKVSKLKEDVKVLRSALKGLKESLRETKAKEKLRKEEANTAPTYRTPTEELLRFGFSVGPRTLNPTSTKLVKAHLADGRFPKSVTVEQLKPFLLDSGYSAIPKGWRAPEIRKAANARIKEYNQFQFIKYRKGRKAEIEAFTERVETLESKISTAQKKIKEQQAEVKDQVDLLAVLQSEKPIKRITDAVEIPPTKLPQLRQAVKEAKQAVKEYEKSSKATEKEALARNKEAIQLANKAAKEKHRKLVAEANERYKVELAAHKARLKARVAKAKDADKVVKEEAREELRSARSNRTTAKKAVTVANREFKKNNRDVELAQKKSDAEQVKLKEADAKFKTFEDAVTKAEEALEKQESADIMTALKAEKSRRAEKAKIEKDIAEATGKNVEDAPLPELTEVSHAVAMERFGKTPTIGMSPWRSLFGNKIQTSFSAEVGHADTFHPMRWIGNEILQESIAKIDPITGMKMPAKMTAHSRAEMRTYRDYLMLGENYREAYKSWKVEEGVSAKEQFLNIADDMFGESVSRVVRGIEESKNPHVNKAAEAIRKTLKELDNTMEAEGIIEKAFDDPNYLPRKILTYRLTEGINTHGMPSLSRFFRDAIKEGHNTKVKESGKGEKLTSEEAMFMSEAYLRNIQERHYRVDYTNNGFLGERSGETLRKYLEVAETPEKVIEAILNKTRLGERDASPRYLKHRMLMDEGYSAQVVGKDGQTRTVTVTDFFDNNAKRLMDGHIRQVYGAIEARKIGLKFNEMIGKSTKENPNPASFGEMWQWIEQAGQREGVENMTVLKDQFDRMEALVKGYSHEKPSAMGTNIRMAQKFAGATYGGSFGTAAIAELGQPLAHASWSAYMSHVGELPKMIKSLTSGTVDNQLLREIAMLTGVGTEGKAYREVSTMLEHHGRGLDEGMSRAEHGLSNLQNGAFKYGLLTSVDAIQRQYTAMLFTQEMMNGALKGRIPYTETRLFQIGLDKEAASSIMRNMKEFASYEKVGGNKLLSFNFEKWTSAEAMEAKAALSEAIYLHTRKVIHQTHSGQLPRILQNPVGRMLFQFRNFTIGSYETQLLSNLQAMDKRAMASFSMNTFFGGLSYMAIVALKHGHDPDKMKELLSADELVKGAFYRSGYASHFPMFMDTIIHTFGGTPLFAHGKPSGLQTSMLDFSASPVGSLVDGLFGMGKGIVAPLISEEYDFSQQDLRKFRKMIPYQNSMGFSYLYGKTAEAFPETSRDNDN